MTVCILSWYNDYINIKYINISIVGDITKKKSAYEQSHFVHGECCVYWKYIKIKGNYFDFHSII